MKTLKTIGFLLLAFQLEAQTIPEKYNDFYFELEELPYDKKFKKLDEAIKKNPSEPWFYQEKGSIYYFKGDIDKSIENYKKALEIDPNYSSTYALLARFIYMNDSTTYDIALEHINKAILLDPEDDFYHIDRGKIYLLLKRFDDADKEANYTLALEGFDVMAAEQLKIETLYQSGRMDELKTFIVKHDLSDEGEFLGIDFCVMLGSVYEELGDVDKACKLYHGAAEPFLMLDEEMPDYIVEKLKGCK